MIEYAIMFCCLAILIQVSRLNVKYRIIAIRVSNIELDIKLFVEVCGKALKEIDNDN